MMAILVVVKRWNAYLIGKPFKIQTDHNSLRFLLDQKTTTLAQQKWVLKMMGYDYQVIYKKGSNNVVADSLSRRPQGELHAITTWHTDLLDGIKMTWTTDPQLAQLISHLQQGTHTSSKFTWQDGQLRRRGRLVVGADSELRTDLLDYFHNSATGGHSGMHATLARLG